MKQVVISRAATVTALGDDLSTLWRRLLAGEGAIAPVTRFATECYTSNHGAAIASLQAAAGDSLMTPLLHRVAAQLSDLPADCRLLVATTKGEIDLLETRRRQKAALTEPDSEGFLARVAEAFALPPAGVTINAACASSTIAVGRGAAMIANGQASAVLVYAADLLSEFVFSGFSALQALAAAPCRPFDQRRSGLNLGEAGVALLLLSEDRAQAEGAPVLARVAGWGAANDAHHVTAPARDGCGLVLACRQALDRARISAGQVCGINAHGTGTVYNDAMELTAFATLFGDRLPPLHGIKGSIGHCLGAAGGVEIAVATQALAEQRLPPTVGCDQPEPAAGGQVGARVQTLAGDYLLCCNSGFGGINGTVILQRITI